jgi:GDP-4-dehydro-6-deoxy-D-mannose reductase
VRYFITGIGGFAGTHLAAHLLEAGHEVTGSVRERRGYPRLEDLAARHPRFAPDALVVADITDANGIADTLAARRPDGVFHLAGIAFVSRAATDPARAIAVNALGTRYVVEAVAAATPAARVVIAGSADVYGASAEKDEPLSEGAVLQPVSVYGLSKAAGEMAAFQVGWEKDVAVIRARAFNHTGPGQSVHFVCSDFARQVARIERGAAPPQLHAGNLQSARDFSDVRDIVRGYTTLMDRGVPGEVYNLCAGHAVTIQTIVDHLRDEVRVPFEVVSESRRVRREIACVVGDPERARALGWTPAIPLRQTLRDLLDYWRVVAGD